MKKTIFAIATLSGTIIGVGVFSLPYITLKSGFWTILIYFLILAPAVSLIHIFLAKLSLKTPDFKRLPGFAKIYLGERGKKITLIVTVLGLSGTLLAYLIVGGEFLKEFLSPIFGGTNLIYTLFYFSLGSILIFFGIKSISKIELVSLFLFFGILILIFIKSFPIISSKNLFLKSSFSTLDFFSPYGVVLFSFWALNIIPEIEEMLSGQKEKIFKVILFSMLICAIFYLFFIYTILGISGQNTTKNSLSGLKNIVGHNILNLAFLIGFLTTFTSYITLGLTLKKIFWYDLKLPKNLSFLITCFPPLFLYFAGIKNFISVISFVGSVMMGINGITVCLMYRKIHPKNFLVYPLILVLGGGIIWEIIYHFLK